ncbi:MAG: hypothetical protein V4736_06100 [Bdellovibrionota bacterium]
MFKRLIVLSLVAVSTFGCAQLANIPKDDLALAKNDLSRSGPQARISPASGLRESQGKGTASCSVCAK